MKRPIVPVIVYLATAAAVALAPRTAQAGDPPRNANADPAAAQSLFYEARTLMQQNNFAAACPKLEESMRLFSMRQHLIVNRRLRFGVLEQDRGDTARVQADYVRGVRHRPGLRVRRPVHLRAAADGGRLAGARGGRAGEVAQAARSGRHRLTATGSPAGTPPNRRRRQPGMDAADRRRRQPGRDAYG